MPKVLEKIPNMNDNDLLILFNNAHNILDKSSSSDAEAVINKIQKVWRERLQLAKKGKYKATTPPIGMLKSFQYAVGNDGLPQKKRQKILDTIFYSDLPVIGSPARFITASNMSRVCRSSNELINLTDVGSIDLAFKIDRVITVI